MEPAPHGPSLALTVAQSDGFEREKAQIVATQLTAFDELAAFCQENKALAERDAIYMTLIQLDPDHKLARKWLRYKKDRKSGEWVQKGYREPRATKDEEIVAEITKRRTELNSKYISSVFALVEKHAEKLGPKRTTAEYKAIVAIDSNHEGARKALGFVAVDKDGERTWLPQSVAVAQKHRTDILTTLSELRAATPDPEKKDPLGSDEEGAFGVDFETVLKTPRALVLGTTGESELETITANAHFQWELLKKLIKGRGGAPEGFTMYVLSEAADKAKFLSENDLFRDADRGIVLQLSSAWLTNYIHVVVWHPNGPTRIDTACKQVTAYYLSQAYRIQREGWIVEGFGQYMSHLICGTRLSYSLVDDEYNDPENAKIDINIGDTEANWFDLASDILEDAPEKHLVKVLGKTGAQMTPADFVISYVMVSYLLEGHGTDTIAELFKRVGAENGGVSSTVALEKMMGIPITEIQTNLKTWVDAVGAHDYLSLIHI